jgi:DNA-binding transcriptional LysR family regulator
VALGRLSLVDSLVREGRLVALFGRRTQVRRALHAVYAPGSAARPEALAFVSWVKAEIGGERKQAADGPAPGRRAKA